jgi:hypothetical protein
MSHRFEVLDKIDDLSAEIAKAIASHLVANGHEEASEQVSKACPSIRMLAQRSYIDIAGVDD